MGETLFEEMRRYVRFGEADHGHLVAFHTTAAPHFTRIAQEFYDRTREHEEAHAVFTGEAQITRLQRSLTTWLHRVFTGTRDEAYFQETSKIGRMHVKIGLPQRYMLTAMALIREALFGLTSSLPKRKGHATRSAISRALDLELAVMLESYRDDFVARLRAIEDLERRETDRAARIVQDRYRNAVELTKMMVVMIDRESRVRLWSREAERITGFARDEVLGRSIVEALCPELDRSSEIVTRAAAGGHLERESIDCLVPTKSGKLRELRFQLCRPPADAEDKEVSLYLLGRDVGEENKLAARVRQAEKLAAVGTLAAGLAHEIRNPLNGAQLHLTFLERALRGREIDPESLEAIGVVSSEIRRLGGLVTEFLDFARPRPLNRRVASLAGLTEHAAQVVRPVAEETRVSLSLELPSSDLEIEMDPEKIEQVILNLLQNGIEAVAATPGASGVIVRLRRTPRMAIFEVEDDGAGLSPPDAPIFDPFFSTKPTGTGLGLAIVHRIVTDHEGTIDVESRPGRTVFRISLPIRAVDVEEDARPS